MIERSMLNTATHSLKISLASRMHTTSSIPSTANGNDAKPNWLRSVQILLRKRPNHPSLFSGAVFMPSDTSWRVTWPKFPSVSVGASCP